MAWIEPKGRKFLLNFRFQGVRHKKLLAVKDRREAEGIAAKAERRLDALQAGEWELGPDEDLVEAVIGLPKPAVAKTVLPKLRLADLFNKYMEALPQGSVEANTRTTLGIHFRNLQRVLGDGFGVPSLKFADLQRYIDIRAKEPGYKGRSLSPHTIKKEMVSFGGVWSWAERMGLVAHAFPNKGLRYNRAVEKPPFQTFGEVKRRIARGGLSTAEADELWECVFLTVEEIEAVLAHVQGSARHDFIYPMVLMAAHTGARRSELCRCEAADVDFEGNRLMLREKKRAKGKSTTRNVPLSPRLQAVMREWMQSRDHRFTFTIDGESISVDVATYHFKQVMAGSDWENLKGWHVFRHSFISNCASRGVDQRMIDEWSGHQTEEMRKRYRHLLPNAQQSALQSVFGG